jgi:predicted RNA-binding Zn ribbon-like protein
MARPRTLIPIEEIPLVGGAVCLDFVNTTGARSSRSPRERLTRYRDLLVWSQRAGIVDAEAAARLSRAARRQPDKAARVLARAYAIRETAYAILLASAEGRPPDRRAVDELARHWRRARGRQELAAAKGGFEVRFVRSDTLDSMLGPIVMSAVDLLTSAERLALLKRCEECDWLFLAESKNGTRRWCKAMCGNRARSRERYARLRETQACSVIADAGSGAGVGTPRTEFLDASIQRL